MVMEVRTGVNTVDQSVAEAGSRNRPRSYTGDQVSSKKRQPGSYTGDQVSRRVGRKSQGSKPGAEIRRVKGKLGQQEIQGNTHKGSGAQEG